MTQGQPLSVNMTVFGSAVRLVESICRLAGAPTFIDDNRVSLARRRVITAVRRHDTAIVFDWLIEALSYQGVADSVAYGYMEQRAPCRQTDCPLFASCAHVPLKPA
jgi:ABC-type proline/glycine betaine transport system ATPase subunit